VAAKALIFFTWLSVRTAQEVRVRVIIRARTIVLGGAIFIR